MIIRKLFKFEGAHVVRNCSSVRCRENIHGHSYVVEVFIESDRLDRGYMVMDFTLLDRVKLLVDSFDHTYSLWEGEPDDFKAFIRRYNRRVAEIPVSPSAEGYALLFFYGLMPLSVLGTSLAAGLLRPYGKMSWLFVPAAAVLALLLPWLTFSLANTLTFGNLNPLDPTAFVFGAAVSAVGFGAGTGVRALRARRHGAR